MKVSAMMQNDYSILARYTSRFLYFAYEAWFITFEGEKRIACYHGTIINNDSSRLKQALRLWGITPYQARTGGDIHIYEFEHNDIDIADELSKNLNKIL